MKRLPLRFIFIFFISLFFSYNLAGQSYLYEDGSIFLDSAMINQTDPSSFVKSTPMGQGTRNMFDRRTGRFDNYSVFLFEAEYLEGNKMEFRINVEFGSADNAQKEVDKYAPLIGQLPTLLKKDIQYINIHQGNFDYGGGNNSILIHTGRTPSYEFDGHLEEVLFHEACHTSMDDPHATSSHWKAAQIKDQTFVTRYAWENPDREDIAETFLLYTAIRYQGDRISQRLINDITMAIPNRMAYFDSLDIELLMWPFTRTTTGLTARNMANELSISLSPNPATHTTLITMETGQKSLLSIQLFDLRGQLIKNLTDQLWIPKGPFQKSIDLSGISPGIYSLHFKTNEGIASKKLVVH